MNPRYRVVFRSHLTLFLLPVVLAGAVALWVGVSAPAMYRSSATLWADVAAGSSSSGSLRPSARDQELLEELLATRRFRGVVARSSPLAEYLESHTTEGWGPMALLARLRPSPSLEERVAVALGPKRVSSSVMGPHVLEVTFDASNPKLAAATLDVILKELIGHRAALRQDAIGVAQKQIVEASEALSQARGELTRYLRAHPSTPRGDPELATLATAELEAATELADASEAMSDAARLLSTASAAQTLRVVDAPQEPLGPTTGRRRLALTLLGGLFAGAVVSAMGIVALAQMRPDNRPPVESDGWMGLRENIPHENGERPVASGSQHPMDGSR